MYFSDTAAVYGNESDIGIALKQLLPKYKLKRSDIFVTSKLCKYITIIGMFIKYNHIPKSH